jgi:hypothetical protein
VINTRHHYYSRPHALSTTKPHESSSTKIKTETNPHTSPRALPSSHFSRWRCGKSASSSLGSDCEEIRNVSLLRACACSSDGDWNQASTHTSSTCCTLSVGLCWFFSTKPLCCPKAASLLNGSYHSCVLLLSSFNTAIGE